MQIERVRAHIVRLPADEPLADNKSTPGATRDIVVVMTPSLASACWSSVTGL